MKKTVFYLIMLLIPIGVIETASYFSLKYLEQRNLTRFDVQRYAQSHMSEEGYKNALRGSFDPDLGWVNRPNTKRTEKNCDGLTVTYEYGKLGERIEPDEHTQATSHKAFVATYGDSFTNGVDVDYGDSWQHFLAKKVSRDILNFGVGGYGSYQAVLRFIRHTQRGIVSPYTILVIYEENIQRVANAYRPFYERTTGAIYGFKPFVAWENDRAIFYDNPNKIPRGSLGDFMGLVQLYERTDYWSKHRNVHVRFPFSINLIRLIVEQNASLAERVATTFGAPILWGYQTPELAGRVEAVIRLFIQHSLKTGTKPVVVFLPSTFQKPPGRDYRVFFQKTKESFVSEDVVFINIAEAKVDWEKFNPRVPDCHTLAYGNQVIAEHIYEKLFRVTAPK